jgi:hypothetical protein
MAWERSFEAKVLKIREKELKYQQLNYTIEVSLLVRRYSLSFLCRRRWAILVDSLERYLVRSFSCQTIMLRLKHGITVTIRSASPILVTLVAFWHFTVIRQEILTPSIAFTSVSFAYYLLVENMYTDVTTLDYWRVNLTSISVKMIANATQSFRK